MKRGAFTLAIVVAACGAPPSPAPHRQAAGSSYAVAPAPVDVTAAWDARRPDAAAASLAAPLSLTTPDGTKLRLAALDARAVVEGPLAYTELRLVFENPDARTIEGTFEVALPPGATMSRFAMRQARGWQEGEVVERGRATSAYESFTHRRIDPALLSKETTSRFRARVFPIEAHARKQILVGWTHALPSPGAPYALALRGLPRLDQLDAELVVPRAAGTKGFAVHKTGWTPDRDLALDLPPADDDALRTGRFVVARVTPHATELAPAPLEATIAVLVDTSASRAADVRAEAQRVAGVLAEMGRAGSATVTVAAFDQDVELVYSGPPSGFGAAQVEKLVARGGLGATDLGAALRWAAAQKATRVILDTDGAATLGGADLAGLADDLRALRAAGARRIDVLSGGADSNDALLAELTSALDRPGFVIGAGTAPAAAVARLRKAARGAARVKVDGASWSWPAAAPPGDAPFLVFAELGAGAPLSITVGDEALHPRVAGGASPLVDRAAVRAKVEDLERRRAAATEASSREALGKQIVELSTKNRVLSDLTSFLVLETEADYARFEIERTAHDVLVVTRRGVELGGREPLDLSRTGAGTPSAGGDKDGDGIPDSADLCPDVPEVFNGVKDDDGCPDNGSVIIQDNSIMILQQVHFQQGSAAVLPECLPIIDEMAQVMVARPDLRVVEVDGHTDNTGNAAENTRLSLARARAVRDLLVTRGVPASRLRVRSFGGTRPIEPNDTEESRAKNRRVEFHILNSGSSAGKRLASPGPAYDGDFAAVMAALAANKAGDARNAAQAWHARAPRDPLAGVALGLCEQTLSNGARAARAFGSLVDLSPRSAEARRAAADFLDALDPRLALSLWSNARDLRPDHPSSHRAVAMALARAGRFEDAIAALVPAVKRAYPANRFLGAVDVMREDLGVLGAAAVRAHPEQRAQIVARLAEAGASIAAAPSLRFVATWEADHTDVDVVLDEPPPKDDETREPPRGVADVRDGYGPEALVVDGARAYPYTLRVQLASLAAGGQAIGRVDVLEHDGAGRVAFQSYPFVLQKAGGSVDLGIIERPLVR